MANRGRHSHLDDKHSKVILTAIKAGLPVKLAAMKVGLTEACVYKWVRQGKLENADAKYVKFVNDYDKALAHAFEMRLKRISGHGKRDWKADAWWIERMYPDLMGSEAAQLRQLKKLLEEVLDTTKGKKKP